VNPSLRIGDQILECDSGSRWILRVRRKGVRVDAFQSRAGFWRRVQGNRAGLAIRNEAERPQIVETKDMVRMGVGVLCRRGEPAGGSLGPCRSPQFVQSADKRQELSSPQPFYRGLPSEAGWKAATFCRGDPPTCKPCSRSPVLALPWKCQYRGM